ncbi:MAG: hypothetical protein N4A35_13810 [Flavobacteriales bacterium]|jgi:hypothetical protein|nr:hypothetical protein [Flavobacteriales bacterium]
MRKLNLLIIFVVITLLEAYAQPVPAAEENIPFLVTFGNKAKTSYGDDDFRQIFYFSIPKDYRKPFYIRIFDPNIGGEHDEIIGDPNTKTKYSVYGGKGCISNRNQRSGAHGNLLGSKTFDSKLTYDDKWYTFGPFNPSQGEYVAKYYGNVFKIIAQGTEGNDGNLYRYYLSTSPTKNTPIDGGNAFTFFYTFRLHADANQVSHIYPYVDNEVISITQTNFDWDSDGSIKLYSVATMAKSLAVSADDKSASSEYFVKKSEKGTSLDIQFQKRKTNTLDNNNVVFYIRNNYGEAMPFYTVPIGGVPKFKGNTKVTVQRRR